MSEREYTYSDRTPRRESERYYDDHLYRTDDADYDTRRPDESHYRAETHQYDDAGTSRRSSYQGETYQGETLSTQDEYAESIPEHVMYPGREFLDDYHYNDRTEPHFPEQSYTEQNYGQQPAESWSAETWPNEQRDVNYPTETAYSHPQDAPHTEEVWIKESQNRISYNDYDLRDVDRPRVSNYKTTLAGFAGVTAMLGLIGFLAFSSAPDLTPEEIIAMQGYAGEQPIKTPFNLASLRECDQIDCAGTSTTITPNTNNSTDRVSADSNETSALPIAQTTTVLNAIPSDASSGYIELQEIPAANNTYSTLSTENNKPVYTEIESNKALQVLQQWSNVRTEPSTDGAIITSLSIGTGVTVLSQTGEWYEISLTDRSFITGYMHRSTVAEK